MMKLNYHLTSLLYFEAAARLKSYSRAAAEHHISQAAVSQKIRELEDNLRCKLFVRKGHEMHLTAEGDILYRHVSSGFDKIALGINSVKAEPKEGLLTISSSPSFATRWLTPRLWKFSNKNPGVTVKLISSPTPELDRTTGIDLVLGEIYNDNNDDSIIKKTLFSEPMFTVCSPKLAKDLNIKSAKDITQAWLIKNINFSNFSWDLWFEEHSINTKECEFNFVEVSNFDLGLSIVASGHGVSQSCNCLAGDLIKEGSIIKVFEPTPNCNLEFSAVYFKDSIRKERILAFVNWLFEEANGNQS